MRCPYCNHEETAVKDSRTMDDQATIRRRRICQKCGCRFTTVERVQLRELIVLKKDGHTVPFDRDKLARSVEHALHKRSVNREQTERMIAAIIRRLETAGEREVATTTIGDLVMESLFHVDAVAYVRFASIYHEFHSVDDFIGFIQKIKEDNQ